MHSHAKTHLHDFGWWEKNHPVHCPNFANCLHMPSRFVSDCVLVSGVFTAVFLNCNSFVIDFSLINTVDIVIYLFIYLY